MGELRHFEDFEVGQVIPLGNYPVSAKEIMEFAAEFDPQDFHLVEEEGMASVLGGHAASGWHVCSMLMRMMADGWLNMTASLGSNSVPEVKWLRPVLAGETLSGILTIFQCFSELFNEAGEKKAEMTAIVFMRVKAAC
jgi:acyl dehydratase